MCSFLYVFHKFDFSLSPDILYSKSHEHCQLKPLLLSDSVVKTSLKRSDRDALSLTLVPIEVYISASAVFKVQ